MVIINSDAILDSMSAFILLGSSITMLIYTIWLIINVLRKG